MKTLNEYFDVKRGISGLTEDFIYNNFGKVPVISASSDKFRIFGHIDYDSVKNNVINKQAILVVRVGKAGITKYMGGDKEFLVTENVLYLLPKEKYKNDFNFTWLENKLRTLFMKNVRGDVQGQRNISAEVINRLSFKKIDLSLQNKIAELLESTEEVKVKISGLIKFLNDTEISDLKVTSGTKEKISKIFNIVGGNSGLSEEFIYYNQATNSEDEISIYSGATSEEKSMGEISKNAILDGTRIKLFKEQCILVV